VYWDRRALAGISGHDTGHSTTRHKLVGKINGLQRAKFPPSDLFSTPVNLLGGGQWRWPNSARLDAITLANILCATIGPAPEKKGADRD
jgi:hypothetical protein